MRSLHRDIQELLKQLEEYIKHLDETTLAKVKEELEELEAKLNKVLNKA